jgi:signal transduction histidine kinase
MALFDKWKPKFWDHYNAAAESRKSLFNYRRIWFLAVFLTAGVSLLPLIFITILNYRATQKGIESEILLRTSRLVSNTRRSITFFLEERKSAINFITRLNPCKELGNTTELFFTLENLKRSFGGFVDLGIIDSSGEQRTYVGPYSMAGKNYKGQEWFKQVLYQGHYVSDVFMGYRQVPHLVVAVKHQLADGSFHVLRATLDTERFNHLLTGLEVSGSGDAFLINGKGVLQTPSRLYGQVLQRISLTIPSYSPKTEVFEAKNLSGESLVLGYAYIQDSPFILMIVKHKKELMREWNWTRMELIVFLAVSIVTILLVILGTATYLVGRIFLADQRRVAVLHEVEYANKMASIGRMAAGVAHEINNPLAIINEKAGLIQDLFAIKKQYQEDAKLKSLIKSILASVQRCSKITRRLLSFARHMEVRIQPINLEEQVREVLGFLGKAAEYQNISINVKVLDQIPPFESDRGKLQQIFLNIINNAIAAMPDGGQLDITIKKDGENAVSISFADTGCGIPQADLNRVFEPFFTTKSQEGGTGLGLSITYSLAQELGGKINVQSQVGKGTTFWITLPLTRQVRKEEPHADTIG